MVQGNVSALIIARPGWLRESLQALVTAVPQIGSVDLVDDGLSALKVVTEHQPALVLLDTNLPEDEIPTVLRRIKARWPQTRCLVLADDGQQQQAAQAAGADDVLLKGYPAARLFVTIEELLKGR